MAISTMRNRVSTEFRKVETGSDEYLELQAQRDPNDGMPVWEETSLPDAVEQSKRLESGRPLPTDIGDAQQPVGKIAGSPPTVTPARDVYDPLPSEREAGAEQDQEASLLPPYNEFDEEVPLTAAMEDPTDTDVSGTEPDLERGGGPAANPAGKSRSRKSGGAKAEGAKQEGTGASLRGADRPASDEPEGDKPKGKKA